MKVLSSLGASVKSAIAEIKSMPFSSMGGGGFGGGAYLPNITNYSGLNAFMGGGLPGTHYDYRTAAGVLWQNPSAAAIFGAMTRAFAQARPQLEKFDGKNWDKVPQHDLTDLLNRPNPFYSGERLFGVTLVSTLSSGGGFWRIERNGAKQPAEFWFEPPIGVGPTGIAPVWDKENFISGYYLIVDGKRQEPMMPVEDVVYFRNGLNPANPRMPWAPLELGAREIATLNGASTYTGALMKNSAVPSGMVTLEGSGLASGTAPSPEQAEDMKAKIKSGFGGDNVGEPFVSSLPWKWQPFNWSPADLNIDGIRQWPQGIVCALLATPEIVALLPTGEQPTYENLSASMEWWWNNTIIPIEDSFADEIETQLFPSFGLDTSEYRLTWDRSKVPALQEDLIAKNSSTDTSYTSGTIDLHEAQVRQGIVDVPEEYKGRFHPSATAGNPDAAPPTPDEIAQQKKLNNAAKSETTENLDMPENAHDDATKAAPPLPEHDPDPFGMAFTQEEIDALTPVNNEAAVKAAFADATPEMRALLSAQQIDRK